VDALRRLPPRFEDLDSTDMGALGALCKAAGLGDDAGLITQGGAKGSRRTL
jgi:hypothetical protein